MRKSSFAQCSPPSMPVSRIVAFASVTVPSAPVFAVLPRHCLCHNPEHQLQITSDKSSQFSHRLSPRFLHWHRLAMLSWNLIHTNFKLCTRILSHVLVHCTNMCNILLDAENVHLPTFLEWDRHRILDRNIGALCLGHMEALLLWHLCHVSLSCILSVSHHIT